MVWSISQEVLFSETVDRFMGEWQKILRASMRAFSASMTVDLNPKNINYVTKTSTGTWIPSQYDIDTTLGNNNIGYST
jgi:hypothetical protein